MHRRCRIFQLLRTRLKFVISPWHFNVDELTRNQKIVVDCLQELQILHQRIIELSIFSPNETLEDISTQDLIYLTVPHVVSEVQGRLKTTNRSERLNSLNETEVRCASSLYISFTQNLLY